MLKNIMPTNDADKDRLIFETSNQTPTSYHNFYKCWQSICIETARKCPHCGTERPKIGLAVAVQSSNAKEKVVPLAKKKDHTNGFVPNVAQQFVKYGKIRIPHAIPCVAR